MRKLYEKNRLHFALVWIGIYCVFQSLANPLNEVVGIGNSVSAVFCLILAVALFAFMRKNGLLQRYGICPPSAPARQFLFYLPLFILASGNLWNGAAVNGPWPEIVFHTVLMLCVGFVEEVIFRGFLFRAIAEDSVKWALVVSSVTFGIGHLLNLVNGSGMTPLENLFQIVGAIAYGFLFVVLFSLGGSLLPCIFTHSAINILSAFTNEVGLTAERRLVFTLIECAVIAAYVIFLILTLPKKRDTEGGGHG